MKSKLHNIILILNEIFLFIYSLLFMIAYKESVWTKGYEWFLISLLVIYTTILSVLAVIEFIWDIGAVFTNKFESPPKEDEDEEKQESIVKLDQE